MRNRQSFTMSLLIGGILIAAPLVAQAGGTIKGKVTFTGKVPPPKEFAFKKFPNTEFCKKNESKSADGNTRLLKEVEVDGSKGLKNAVVSVRDVEDKGFTDKAKKEAPQSVVAELCEFKPYTGIAVSLGQFKVVNNDADPSDPKSAEGVLHNPHSFDQLGAKSSTEFNIGLAKKGDSLDKSVKLKMSKKGSVLRLQCDQHEFMQAWYLPVTNAHYGVAGADGTFEIKDVPAGKHKVMAWHPIAGQVEADVDVKDGGTVEANFEIK
ncbi:MAG: carboxypeptidase-like regulatory domain-containing protein [Nitrospirota bacterium]|jgi:type 1 fimbria pilin|nr:carboxypeptidase-like regulatory domain-containing protein [Nitrospirota bacterium]MDH4359141.1 carboxypeptidase-like regulatory domain-containing protein [Nitrospirota bacterium]MDH5575800.1 carboxypeptidase-like regulatory domain-containing protein [Nitrospirota bacterium]